MVQSAQIIKMANPEKKLESIETSNQIELFQLPISRNNSEINNQESSLQSAQHLIEEFQATKFAQKEINIRQAFISLSSPNANPFSPKLNLEEASELKEWTDQKSKLLKKKPITIYMSLYLISISAPNIIEEIVKPKKDQFGFPNITRQKLEIVTGAFPGEENYNLQKTILFYKNHLTKSQIITIVDKLKSSDQLSIDKSRILNVIQSTETENINIKQIKNNHNSNKTIKRSNQTKTDSLPKIESKKNTSNKVNSWVRDEKYSLTPKEQVLYSINRYLPKRNIFKFAKEKLHIVNKATVVSYIQSAESKIRIVDSGEVFQPRKPYTKKN
jgi:hypothetical protein